MKIAVIGAGKWGQALYSALKINNDCIISSRTKRDIEGFVELDKALECDYLLFSISTQKTHEFLRSNFKSQINKLNIYFLMKSINEQGVRYGIEAEGRWALPTPSSQSKAIGDSFPMD